MIRILCRGPLDWTLGSEYLLLALRGLLDRGVEATLCIAGDGPERERILFAIEDLKLGDVARVVSDPVDPADLLDEADVFVLAVLDDRPRPEVRSALAAGLPVVWGQRTGVSTPVQHELTGLCVRCRDPDALRDALSRLDADPVLRARLSNGARENSR